MTIETTFENLKDTIRENEKLLCACRSTLAQEDVDIRLQISGYRVVVPESMLSFRTGYLLRQHGGEIYESFDPVSGELVLETDYPDGDSPWEPETAVTLLYEEKETDAERYISWSMDSPQNMVFDELYPKVKDFEELNPYRCILEWE